MNHRSFVKFALLILGIGAAAKPEEPRRLLSVHRGDNLWHIWLDGVKQMKVISCKTGRNGWVQRYVEPLREEPCGGVARERLRGHVVAKPGKPEDWA